MDDHPMDDLFRGVSTTPELRGLDAAAGSVMYGHLAVFDVWSEISSWFEGDFMERLSPGAFKRTIKNNKDQMRVTFDHGYDYTLADKPLGPIDKLEEDDLGVAYEVPLLDTDYNRDFMLPALQGRLLDGRTVGSDGLLGASFRFRVIAETWERAPAASDHNPKALAERTITEVRLYEFGPVVYPAYPEATAKVRSLTDHYIERRLERQGTTTRAAQRLANIAPSGQATGVQDNHDRPGDPPPEFTGTDPHAVRALASALGR